MINFLTILLVSTLAALCTQAGSLIVRRAFTKSLFRNSYWIAGAGYFVGHSLFLFYWRIAELLIGSAQLALYFAAAGIVISAVRAPRLRLSWKTSLLILTFVAVVFGYWTDGISPDVLANLGSLHTGRYSNLALYIAESNRFPVVGQNFEQSILASIAPLCGIKRPGLTLSLWLILSQTAFALALFGLLLAFDLKPREALVGTVIVLFGQCSLSLTHIITLDFHNPFGMMGYSDSVRSVGSFLIFISILTSRLTLNRWVSVILAVFWFGWPIGAPQNSFLALFLLGALALSNSQGLLMHSLNA